MLSMRIIESRNPFAPSEIIESFPSTSPDDVAKAVSAARTAQLEWEKNAFSRAAALSKCAAVFREHQDEIISLIVREVAKPITEARGEFARSVAILDYYAQAALDSDGETFPNAINGYLLSIRKPHGVVGIITPWNFPAAMATRKIGPALAAGCTVILKPAGETPLTAIAIVEILERAGVPAGVVNLILPVPSGPAIAKILKDPRVVNLSFTGSTEVGRVLLKEAADRVIRTSMELGGNAPFLVLADANVDDAVSGAMLAKMRNGGAACTAANRFYVAKELAEDFTSKLAAAMSQLKMAPGTSNGAQLGASVSVKERNKIAELVDSSVSAGAVVKTGGKTPDGTGAFYPATVLTVKNNNPILAQEIFGPVAPIVVTTSDEEAIELANATEFGLIAYVYSSDLKRAIKVAEALESGMVAINKGVISDPAAPFGGVKQSGLGREGGFAGIEEFLETKYIGVEI